VVYTAEHLSLAMIEYLVHLDADHPPEDMVLARAEVPDDVSRIQLDAADLPVDWRSYPPPEALSAIGDAFARELRAAVLIVPSSIAVTDHNWILNPGHSEFRNIGFHAAEPFAYDPRLLKGEKRKRT
jgi:RES domain-containing protein